MSEPEQFVNLLIPGIRAMIKDTDLLDRLGAVELRYELDENTATVIITRQLEYGESEDVIAITYDPIDDIVGIDIYYEEDLNYLDVYNIVRSVVQTLYYMGKRNILVVFSKACWHRGEPKHDFTVRFM